MSVAQALLKCVGKTTSGPPPASGIGTWVAANTDLNTIFARSTDNGATWYPVNTNSQYGHAEIETNGNTWYCPINSSPHRSTDNGLTWQIMPYNLANYVIPTTGTNWVGIAYVNDTLMQTAISTDNLTTFTLGTIDMSAVPGYVDIKDGVYSNSVIYFLGDNKSFRSVDGGTSYTVINSTQFGNAIAANGAVFITAGVLLKRSTNSGFSFTTITIPANPDGGQSTQLWCVGANTSNGTWIAAGFDGYVIRSTDNGITWTKLAYNLGLPDDVPFGFRDVKYHSGAWVIVTDIGYALRSTDNGITWSALPRGLNTGNTTSQFYGLAVNNL